MRPTRSSLAADREAACRHESYWRQTHRPLHSLVFVLPILIAFEIGVAVCGTDLVARNILQRFLTQFGAPATHLSAALLVTVLLVWHITARHRWQVEPYVLAGMIAEAMLLAIPLVGLGILSGRLMAAYALTQPLAEPSIWETLLAHLGGGLYEEFIFRLAGLNLIGLLLLDVLSLPKDLGRTLAILATSALFAMYHFPGDQPIIWPRFAFFFLAGCYQGAVYLLRGFGVAVGAHAFYNMIVLWLEIDPLG